MSLGAIDLTRGGIFEKLVKVALPIMGIQFMQMAYNLTDMFWLGRLGSDAVAASGSAGMYLWLSMSAMMFGRMGAEIGVSQNLGRGKPEEAAMYSRTSLSLNAITGTVICIMFIVFAPFFISFFAIPEQHVVLDAERYLRWVVPSLPFQFIGSVIGGTFSACGNTKLPLYINFAGLLTNIILDPLMIFTFNLGVVGAAIATVGSNALSCLLLLLVMSKSKQRPFEKYGYFTKIRKNYLSDIVRWATPVAIEGFCFSFLSMLSSRIVASFGSTAIAVQKLGSQIESLSWLIAGGFASALTAFVGQNFGAGKWSRIHKSTAISYKSMAVWGVFTSIVLFLGGGFFFSLFIDEAAVITEGARMMRFTVIGILPTCVENVAMGVFRGIGRTKPPAIVSITSNVLRVPLAYFLSKTALGIGGVWLGMALGALMRGVWIMIWQLRFASRDPKEDIII